MPAKLTIEGNNFAELRESLSRLEGTLGVDPEESDVAASLRAFRTVIDNLYIGNLDAAEEALRGYFGAEASDVNFKTWLMSLFEQYFFGAETT
jgi:hypothetical protein